MWLRLLIAVLLLRYLKAECNVCQVGKAACRSVNTFSMCLNGGIDENKLMCPLDYVCTGEKFICYPKAEYKPICNEVDYNAFCSAQSAMGYYIDQNDPTCNTFILCQQNGKNGPILGFKYNCDDPDKPYFDGKKCVENKPESCKQI